MTKAQINDYFLDYQSNFYGLKLKNKFITFSHLSQLLTKSGLIIFFVSFNFHVFADAWTATVAPGFQTDIKHMQYQKSRNDF